MKELVNIFQKNKNTILNQLLEKIKLSKLNEVKSENLDDVFLKFYALETIYAVDKDFILLSPIFNRNSKNEKYTDKIKQTLKNNTYLEGSDHFISSPYVSNKSNKYVITLVKKVDDRLIAFDFDLYKLLNEFNHTDFTSKLFLISSRVIYAIIGISLTIFALILVYFAMYDFIKNIIEDSTNIFHFIFKSSIALTLGLAIFDLAKNLLEHEVVFKEQSNETHGGNKLLVKFLISIVIALSIESLMMVFKIAINDYKDILYAVYLLLAIGFVLIAMSQFNKYLPKKSR